jgi:sec-independent protein translocase protein TatA
MHAVTVEGVQNAFRLQGRGTIAPARQCRVTSVYAARHLSPKTKGERMGLGIPELLIILAIIILIFGANRLPEIGRGIGRGIKNFKESIKEGPEKS